MSSRIPSFLLGGINKTYNFLGTRTARTVAYGVFETGVRLSPVFLIVMAGTYSECDNELEAPMIPADQVPQRRSSLTQ